MNETCEGISLFKGKDGKTVLNGASDPVTGVGVVGDFYINTTDWTIFGPKTTTGWGAGVSIIGTNGVEGENGAFSSEWTFDNATTANPAAKTFRMDDLIPNNVTEIHINETNIGSIDLNAFLVGMNNAGSFGLIKISKKGDSSIFWMGTILNTTDPGAFHTISVAPMVTNGTFTNNDTCVISYVQNGEDGSDGDNGDFTVTSVQAPDDDICPNGGTKIQVISGIDGVTVLSTTYACNGIDGTRPYKVYAALLTQVGTDDPTAVILENSIGAITWTRLGVGEYSASSAALFNNTKMICQMTGSTWALNQANIINISCYNPSQVLLKVYDASGVKTDGALQGPVGINLIQYD